MTPLDANGRAAVNLSNAQWQTVLATMAEGPFRVVADLMQEIARQVQAGQQATEPLPEEKAS